MIDFIVKHWLTIVLVFASCCEVLASIVVISKTPKNKVLTALKEVFLKLPDFIIEAESLLYGGHQKKVFVLKRCVSLLSEKTGFSESKIEKFYFNDISKLIEDILSAPQKKGV